MYVENIVIYPVASTRGLSLTEAAVESYGLAGDRQWTVVQTGGDDPGGTISQMTPGGENLATVTVIRSADGATLTCIADGCDSVTVDNDIRLADGGDEAAAWFSKIVGMDCRLIRTPRKDSRSYMSMSGKALHKATRLPIHLTSQASLAALKDKFTEGPLIEMERFRPNIVINGSDLAPFAEDTFRDVRIGGAIIRLVMPQRRCKIPTVDQKTGEISSLREPLKTLAKWRAGRGDDIQGVFFGQRAIVMQPGVIRHGEPVEVLSQQPEHAALLNVKLGVNRAIPG